MNIREIAKLAGVSVATVSRCLNQPQKVAPKTRERILNLIESLDYVRNPAAHSLSTGRTRTIACVVPTLRNEVFSEIAEGSQMVFLDAGYRQLIYSTYPYSGENAPKFWDQLDQRAVDGIVFCGSNFTRDVRGHLLQIRIPYVLIENPEELELPDGVASVYIEDDNGIRLALKYLHAEGNRRFGIMSGDDDSLVTERRLRAVADFFANRPDCSFQVERANYDDPGGSRLRTLAFLKSDPRPTAVLAFSDMLALGVLRCLAREGVKVPEEMEVIGFDGIPLGNYVSPSLSTVVAPNRRLGEKAAELLLERLEGESMPQNILYPVRLRLGESTKNRISPESVL